jgi:outer membrane protein TolC
MKTQILFGALLLGATAVAHAQGSLPSLTLTEALDIARERNPTYRRARNEIDVAAAGVRAGWGAFMPNLDAGMSWSGNSRTQVTGQDDFGRTVALDNPVTFQSSSVSQSVSGSLVLFDGLSNINSLRAARQDVTAAHAGVRSQGLQVDADVAQRFYGAIRAARLINVEHELLESARETLAANERLFRVAARDQVDVLGAQLEVARQEQNLERQQGEARKARLEVLQFLGILDEVLDFEPVGTFPVVFDPLSLDAGQHVAAALQALQLRTVCAVAGLQPLPDFAANSAGRPCFAPSRRILPRDEVSGRTRYSRCSHRSAGCL